MYPLVDLLGNDLVERQQPKTERNLVAHLWSRLALQNVDETESVMSRRVRGQVSSIHTPFDNAWYFPYHLPTVWSG